MEHGFFHPSWGYWQTNDDVPDFIRETYPEGTVEIPLKPGEYYEYNGYEWVEGSPPTPTEDEIRRIRDKLLADSDWTQLPDAQSSMSAYTKEAWAIYRQSLRDIPEQESFPENVVWPIKP